MSSPADGRLLRQLTSVALVVSAVSGAVVGCSGESGTRPRPGGDSIGTTTPPGTDIPGGQNTIGSIGQPAAVGDWMVIVRAIAETGSPDGAGATEPGDDGKGRDGTARLRLGVQLRQDRQSSLTVIRSDWRLEDGEGRAYEPLEKQRAALHGAATVPNGEQRTVTLEFAVPDAGGSYVLYFEPVQGGPGVLAVAVP
ncbi:MAG TPA: hypothetical protein VLA05_03750 [Coriobacteriia bacterium]|nr:hypothetical protein [Coriobacteriia bacterium]